MGPSANAPSFDGKGGAFANYAHEVAMWRQVANLGPSRRASAFILHKAARLLEATKSWARMAR